MMISAISKEFEEDIFRGDVIVAAVEGIVAAV